jgi:hypothetical protein
LYADLVHPSVTGHARLSDLLLETLTLGFVQGADSWTHSLADYARQYDDGTFEDTTGYTSINATGGTVTGTWATVATTQRTSSTADSTIEFTGTFRSWGFEMGTYDNSAVSIGITTDGGVEQIVGSLGANRPYIRMAVDMTDASHTIKIRVISGTFHLARFLAI